MDHKQHTSWQPGSERTVSCRLAYGSVGSNGRRGFTLVELLMVMVIILILATMGGALWSSVRNKAKMRIAENDCQHIVMANQSYMLAFGIWPMLSTNFWTGITQIVQSATHAIPIDKPYFELMNTALAASGNYGRSIRFFSGDATEFNTNGFLCDPWGGAYLIRFDLSETNCIPHPFKQGQYIHASVIVWSPGADGVMSTNAPFNDAVNKDNPISWGEQL